MVNERIILFVALLATSLLTACTIPRAFNGVNGVITPTISASPLAAHHPQSSSEHHLTALFDAAPQADRLTLPQANVASTTSTAISTTTVTQTQQSIFVEIVTAEINLRGGPSLDAPIVRAAKQGEQFVVMGTDPTRFWLNIITAEGAAWLAGGGYYSTLHGGTIDQLPLVEPQASASSSLQEFLSDLLPNPSSQATAVGQPLIQPDTIDSATPDSLSGSLIFKTHSGGELYRINLDGSGLTFLTGLEDNPTTFHGGVIDPSVSPDGQKIAFTRWDGAEFGTLYTINVDGTDEQVILSGIRQPKSPTWSPDGQQIVFSFQHGGLRDPVEECRRFDADDGIRLPENIEITSFHANLERIQICFIPFEDLRWSLRRVEVETGQFEDLPTDLYSYTPTWNPQQPQQIIYKGDKGLMQLDLNNGTNLPLTDNLQDGDPIFSPDGSTLAMTFKQHDHWEVYTLDVASGARQRLTKPPILAEPQYNSAAPTWSPDGQQIAFLTDRTGSWEVWLMQADGREPRPMFGPEVQAQLNLRYDGFNEQMLNWVGE